MRIGKSSKAMARTWANVVTRKCAMNIVMNNMIGHGLKGNANDELIIMTSKTFAINIDHNKNWQIYKMGLKYPDKGDLLSALSAEDLLFYMEDADWIKRHLDAYDLSTLVYMSECKPPNKWRQLNWIKQVFGEDQNALFIALHQCEDLMLTPSWLLDHFDNHTYIYHFMNRQFKLNSPDCENYFRSLSTLTNEDFLFKHLIGSGVLYTSTCDYLRSILSPEKYDLAISERLDKLDIL